MHTAESVATYLEGRATPYGGTLGDILSKTPVSLWDNPDELMEFWETKDLSHIYPQSVYPELANVWTNIVAEDSSVNRARGAEIMSDADVHVAYMDNELDGQVIDSFYGGDDSEYADALLDLVA